MGMNTIASSFVVVTLVVAASGCGGDGAPQMSEPATGAADGGGGFVDGGTLGPAGGDSAVPTMRTEPDPPSNAQSCVPDPAVFERDILPILDARCGACHGETTQAGAPFALTDYAAMVAGEPGKRISDRTFAALAQGTMPPAGNLRPPPSEHDMLVGWASCGQEQPEYPTGLVASRPIFQAPVEPPVGTELVELRAERFALPAGTTDLYQDFFFDGVVSDEVFVRRMDVAVDRPRVVHHITLHYHGDATNYLYAWAPGTGAVEFSDGGLRIGPQDGFRVEIHYNNPTEVDEVDSSGVQLWVAPPEGREYAMLDPATFAIQVPPMGTATAEAECVAANDFTIVAGMPHMHEIGDTFLHTVTRADSGQTETLIELEGWSFDLQFFYSMPMEIRTGDTMTIRCGYRNDKDRTVTGGLGTTDEMCFDFIYVTPRSASSPCGNGFGRGLP